VAISDETRLGGGTLTALPRGRPEVADAIAVPTGRARRLRRWLFVADLSASAVAAAIAVVVWNLSGTGETASLGIEIFAAVAMVSMPVVTLRTRASAMSVRRLLDSGAGRLASTALDVVAAGSIMLIVAVLGTFGASVPWVAILALMASGFVLLPVGRIAAREYAEPVRIVLVGTGVFAGELRGKLLRARGVELTAIVASAASACEDPSAIERLCDRYDADGLLVVVADAVPEDSRAQPFVRLAADEILKPDSGPDSRPDVDALMRISRHVPVSVAVQLSDGGSLPIFKVGGAPSRSVRLVKRGVDILVSTLALFVLSPLLLVLMVGVGLESGIPLLFQQRRLGAGKKPFNILKLRTMRPATSGALDGAEPRTPFSHPADPMLVTKIGAVLRRTSLDEIPQLINVLRGEMSLVGPRPFVPVECEALPAWAAPRFGTRPGLTGIWQVCGQHTVSVDELCWLDLFYVSCWTVAADVQIVLLTPARLLRGSSR
jgi:lipopolysaccharide/colanic/teichoic acid biosynthesis glycosyltransferase